MYSKSIGDYKLLCKIGSGAFSVIYKALYNGKLVAIKKIDNSISKERFIKLFKSKLGIVS